MNRVGLVCQKSQQMELTNRALSNALSTIGQKAWPCLAHSSPYLFSFGSSSVARKACSSRRTLFAAVMSLQADSHLWVAMGLCVWNRIRLKKFSSRATRTANQCLLRSLMPLNSGDTYVRRSWLPHRRPKAFVSIVDFCHQLRSETPAYNDVRHLSRRKNGRERDYGIEMADCQSCAENSFFSIIKRKTSSGDFYDPFCSWCRCHWRCV